MIGEKLFTNSKNQNKSLTILRALMYRPVLQCLTQSAAVTHSVIFISVVDTLVKLFSSLATDQDADRPRLWFVSSVLYEIRTCVNSLVFFKES